MKPINTSTFTFPDFVGGGFVYVDKTAILRELLRDGKNQYFCVRPRRFGKSLAISTLQCIFEGRRATSVSGSFGRAIGQTTLLS